MNLPPHQPMVSDAASVKAALQHYHDLPFLGACELASLRLVQQRLPEGPEVTPVLVGQLVQALLDEALALLKPPDNTANTAPALRIYTALTLTYQQSSAPKDIPARLHVSRAQYYRDLAQGIEQIAAFLCQWENHNVAGAHSAPQSPTAAWRAHLPPSNYTCLFGVETLLSHVLELLATPERQRFIVLDGLGGMGKTALARELALTAMESGLFTALTWETAQRQVFKWEKVQLSTAPALTVDELLNSIARQTGNAHLATWPSAQKREALHVLLHAQPYLVVVDNLETAADYHALAEELWALTGPSKVLITSRYRLDTFEQATSVHVGALPPAAATALLRYHAQERGERALQEADDAILARIYQATGGNPLALKLVVGQAALRPLAQVLTEIAEARDDLETFYRFIYWAAWELLSADARQLLLSLPLLATTGGPWEALVAIGGLDERQTLASVRELARLSLLEIGGDALQKCYSIHPLTRNFILSDLVQSAPDAAP